MAVLKLGGEGVWWARSKKDPRWNCSGITKQLGGYYGPNELSDKLNGLEKQFGERPEDLMWQSLPVEFIAKVMEKVGNDVAKLQVLVRISDDEMNALHGQ